MKEVGEIDFQIIANLNSGNGEAKRKLENLEKFLEQRNLTYRVLAIEGYLPVDDVKERERILIKKGVVCIGGDGSVSCTVGYLFNNQIKAPLGIIPCGTANFIAESLGYQKDLKSFEFLLKDKVKLVDVGEADFGGRKEYFILGIGIGFEENFLRLTRALKKKFGIFSYIFSALKELFFLKGYPVEIMMNGASLKKKACLLTILNLHPIVLRSFPLFKDDRVSIEDGKLDLFFVEYKNFLQGFAGTLAFHLLGRVNFGLVNWYQGETFKVVSKEEVGCQIDGELKGSLPVKVCIIKKRVPFLVP